jgi:hypothetical protein
MTIGAVAAAATHGKRPASSPQAGISNTLGIKGGCIYFTRGQRWPSREVMHRSCQKLRPPWPNSCADYPPPGRARVALSSGSCLPMQPIETKAAIDRTIRLATKRHGTRCSTRTATEKYRNRLVPDAEGNIPKPDLPGPGPGVARIERMKTGTSQCTRTHALTRAFFRVSGEMRTFLRMSTGADAELEPGQRADRALLQGNPDGEKLWLDNEQGPPPSD